MTKDLNEVAWAQVSKRGEFYDAEIVSEIRVNKVEDL